MFRYNADTSFTAEQIIGADIHEIEWQGNRGERELLGYCIGNYDEFKPLYPTLAQAYHAYHSSIPVFANN